MFLKIMFLDLKDNIKKIFYFIKNIPGYYKLQKDYGYDPDTYSYIIENYETVLCERTKLMSKPTYHWKDVIREIDRWYEDMNEWKEEDWK